MGRVKEVLMSDDRELMFAALACLIELRMSLNIPTENEELYWAMVQSADITIEQLEDRLGIRREDERGPAEDDRPTVRGLVEIFSQGKPVVN